MTQDYYGTKRIRAYPMENDGQPGYGVVYPDGYQSWSPKDVFEAAYQPITAMSFGHAIAAMKDGHRVARAGWNGKGMWLSLSGPAKTARQIPADAFWSKNNAEYATEQGGYASVLPCFTMKTATGEILMGWLASQTDMLADDWQIVEDAA